MLEEEIIGSVVSGVTESIVTSAGGSPAGGDGKGTAKAENKRPAGREISIPGLILVVVGMFLFIGYFTMSKVQTISIVAPYMHYFDFILSIACPIIGVLLIAAGIGYEVWDSHRIWRRPMFRIKRELLSGLRTLHLVTPSTIENTGIMLDGLKVDRYHWNQTAYSATVRVRHPGNARLTMEALERLANANPFRYAHSVEVEQFTNRRGAPDGYLIHIYYKSVSQIADRQLQGSKPWETK